MAADAGSLEAPGREPIWVKPVDCGVIFAGDLSPAAAGAPLAIPL